jgi:tRNA(Ile)-lysidine synthase
MASPRSTLSPGQALRIFLETLQRPARLLVAVSGGSDSIGLLVGLADCLSELAIKDITLSAATIDHGLRPESAGEARTVAALCATLGIAHVIRRWEEEKPKAGISAAAREARYRLLVEIAEGIDATAILTGHTFDDQRETISMRATRNDGQDSPGLAGMAPAVLLHRRRWLLRPLLLTHRADTRQLLAARGIEWVDDPSNLDLHYERVRMRQRLAGEGEAGPGASDSIAADPAEIERAAARRVSLADQAAGLIREHLTIRHGVLAHLAPAGLVGDSAVRRHALAAIASVLGGRPYGPKTESMTRIMAFIDSGLAGRVTAGRVIFDRRREGLYLHREHRGLLPVTILPGEDGLWDNRYRIRNAGEIPVTVGTAPADRLRARDLFDDVPSSIAMRAMGVMPHVESFSDSFAQDVHIDPVIAPFDRFLPQFELNLANEFAALFGCDDFPRLPVNVSARKR